MSLHRTLLAIDVTETDKGKDYWASRPWLSNDEDVRAADVLIVPWENFREEKPALFPQGTGDFYRELLAGLANHRIAVAVDQAKYEELALHADELRLPTLFITLVALPFVINLLSAKIDRLLSDPSPVSLVEMQVIVEGQQGPCLSIKYKGPPSGMIETISKQAANCLPKVDQNKKPKRTNK
jgi:hypothetical protein